MDARPTRLPWRKIFGLGQTVDYGELTRVCVANTVLPATDTEKSS